MNRLERMKSYLPEHFAKSPEIIAILEDGDRRFNEMDSAMDDVLNQFFVETATWGLDKWEEELEILPSGTEFEERRKRVFSKLISQTPTHYKAIENEINRFLSESTSVVRLIKGRYAMRISVPLAESIDHSYSDIKNKVEEIKPTHLRALYYFNETVKLPKLPSILSTCLVKMAFSSVPWMQAGFGSQGETIQLDGSYLLNGERFLNGFYNKDGPVHLQRIKLKLNVRHGFGSYLVNLTPSLDGEFHLDGKILLQNEPQTARLPILHDTNMRYQQREVINVSQRHAAPIKISSACRTGITTLNGQVAMDGSIPLDQALSTHGGLFRVKKAGAVVEEVAIG
ncbi:putative phage tail protein [Sporosarcina sp. P17b]|uniref:putative phage tail protein n=1 Tax=Sporosarcina sp. P17b TaxID=2048260 RepID=UPI000C16A128|nr:putative phage tail protein [Sporosarcina sp. P17b]PIC72540.1 hypothetical protein CSV76_15035 [Sporosarcina sp. P17b]